MRSRNATVIYGNELDELRNELYVAQGRLIAAREEIAWLERLLEYEALIDNQRFWREVEADRVVDR